GAAAPRPAWAERPRAQTVNAPRAEPGRFAANSRYPWRSRSEPEAAKAARSGIQHDDLPAADGGDCQCTLVGAIAPQAECARNPGKTCVLRQARGGQRIALACPYQRGDGRNAVIGQR